MQEFFARHDRLLTVFGALFVFSGFLLNSVVLERTKDLTAEIKEARDAASSARRNHDVDTSLSDIYNSVVAPPKLPQPKTENGKGVQKILTVFKTNRQDLDIQIMWVGSILQDDLQLADALPDMPKPLKSRRQALETAVDTLDTQRHQLYIVLRDLDTGLKNPDDTDRANKIVQSTQSQLDATQTAFAAVGNSIQQFDQDLRSEADYEEKRQKARLVRATYLSYLLFSLGWSMGLVGKLLKVPSLEVGSAS